MKNRKTSLNLSEENYKRIQKLIAETGRSQSDLINSAISNVPIIVLGNQKKIAEIFFDLHKAVSQSDIAKIQEEVDRACRCLNLLMAKIEELTPSEKA